MLTIPDLLVINYLNKKYPWSTKKINRVFTQLISSIIIATLVAFIITLISNSISKYNDNLINVIINNTLITNVLNIIMVSVLEALLFYSDNLKTKEEAKNLKEELIQIRFDVLKNQINPHFLFNSLNVLSGLINNDIKKAQIFIEEFSNIYRYVLETIEQSVTTLDKELEFARSYLLLQQIRHGNYLNYTINIPAYQFKKFLPPLSMQILLENAIKHNIVNESNPLSIYIYCENNCLIIKNNLQPKISATYSSGLGLNNITKRYSYICKINPEFYAEKNFFTAKLPLIEI